MWGKVNTILPSIQQTLKKAFHEKHFRIVSTFEKMDKHNENQDEQRNSGTAPQGKPSNVSFHLVHETIFKGRGPAARTIMCASVQQNA